MLTQMSAQNCSCQLKEVKKELLWSSTEWPWPGNTDLGDLITTFQDANSFTVEQSHSEKGLFKHDRNIRKVGDGKMRGTSAIGFRC